MLNSCKRERRDRLRALSYELLMMLIDIWIIDFGTTLLQPTCPFSTGLFQWLCILIDLINLSYLLSHISMLLLPLASCGYLLILGPEHHLFIFLLSCLILLTRLLLVQHSLALRVLLLKLLASDNMMLHHDLVAFQHLHLSRLLRLLRLLLEKSICLSLLLRVLNLPRLQLVAA